MTLHDAIRQFIKRNASIYESQYNAFLNKNSVYPTDNLIKFNGMDEDDDDEDDDDQDDDDEDEEEKEPENIDNLFDIEDNDNNNHDNNNNNNHNNNNNDDRVETLKDIENKMKNILRQFSTLSAQIKAIRNNPPQDMIQYGVRRIQDTLHVILYVFI